MSILEKILLSETYNRIKNSFYFLKGIIVESFYH